MDAERYDRTRPRYPCAMVDRIVAESPGSYFLDVGCGTGIEARQFQAAGCRVLGVEPDARMADFARRSGVEVEVVRFEDWDPAGRAFDAVVAGTAWHWVDPVAGAAKAAQALRPGGRLAAFHHVPQLPADVAEVFAALYRRVAPESPFTFRQSARPALDAYQVLFAKAAAGIREAGLFSDVEQWGYDWVQSYTRDEWLDQLPTSGAVTQLPPDKLAEVLKGVGPRSTQWGAASRCPIARLLSPRREPRLRATLHQRANKLRSACSVRGSQLQRGWNGSADIGDRHQPGLRCFSGGG